MQISLLQKTNLLSNRFRGPLSSEVRKQLLVSYSDKNWRLRSITEHHDAVTVVDCNTV